MLLVSLGLCFTSTLISQSVCQPGVVVRDEAKCAGQVSP